jgi:hypothetical protein
MLLLFRPAGLHLLYPLEELKWLVFFRCAGPELLAIQWPTLLQIRMLTLPQFETSLAERASPSQDISLDLPTRWTSQKQMWPSIEPLASVEIEPKRPKVPLPPDPRPPPQRKTRKPPSGEVRRSRFLRDLRVYREPVAKSQPLRLSNDDDSRTALPSLPSASAARGRWKSCGRSWPNALTPIGKCRTA